MPKKLCNKCRPLFEESYLASARHVLKDGERLLLESKVIEAAKALHAAMIQSYDGEPVPLAVMVEFKTAVEALQEVEQ